MFDWRKGALCLMSVVALCALSGSASDLPPGFPDLPPGFPDPLNPFNPLNPYNPFDPNNPLPPVEPEDFADRLEPILRFLGSFIAGDSGPKFEEYDARVRDDDEDYEAHICRGFVRLTSLSESALVLTFVEKFGFKVDEDSGAIGFSSPKSWFDFGEELRDNVDVGTKEMMEVRAMFVKSLSGDIDVPPWEELPVPVGENATAAVKDGICTISGEGSVTGFPPGFDCGSISNAEVESCIAEIGEGFFYPCLSLKKILIWNSSAINGLEKAVVDRTAINPDGTLYPIPSISIPGYEEVLCGANDPTGKDGWEPVPSDTRMEDSGYHFFKYVLKSATPPQ